MSEDILTALTAMVNRRARLAAELAEIDSKIDAVHATLGRVAAAPGTTSTDADPGEGTQSAKVLAILRKSGRVRFADLHRASGVREGSLGVILRHLRGSGLVRKVERGVYEPIVNGGGR